MKIYLQHKETSRFLQKLDAWTENYQSAFDFQQARKAIEFVKLHSLDHVQIMVVATTKRGTVHKLPFEIPESLLYPEGAPRSVTSKR